MFLLTECKHCGFVWSTPKLASECETVDKKRDEMNKEDNANMNANFRSTPQPVEDEGYPG